MAKTFSLSAIRELDARIENQLHRFEAEEEEEQPKKGWSKGQWAAGAAGSAAASAAIHRPDLVKKGAKTAANKGLLAGAKGLRKGAAGLAGMRRKLHGLHARVDEQLQQFGLAPEEYVSERTSRKKKRRAVAGAAMAGAAVAGGVAAAGKREQIAEAVKTAGFRGMRKGAEVLKKGGKVADKLGAKGTGAKLAKAGKALRKGSMKLFAARIDAVAKGLVRFGI